MASSLSPSASLPISQKKPRTRSFSSSHVQSQFSTGLLATVKFDYSGVGAACRAGDRKRGRCAAFSVQEASSRTRRGQLARPRGSNFMIREDERLDVVELLKRRGNPDHPLCEAFLSGAEGNVGYRNASTTVEFRKEGWIQRSCPGYPRISCGRRIVCTVCCLCPTG